METIPVERARNALDLNRLRARLPSKPEIRSLSVEDYVDWEGKDALRVLAIIDEATTDDELTGEAAIEIRSAIVDSLAADGIEEFPYLSFAKPSELDDLNGAE